MGIPEEGEGGEAERGEERSWREGKEELEGGEWGVGVRIRGSEGSRRSK